jgi:hypothetical protein
MDEQEAEAALLALGPQLEWHEQKHDYGYFTVSNVAGGNKRYAIRSGFTIGEHTGLAFSVNLQNSTLSHVLGGPRKHYPDLPAAKAACERHYATGSW